MGLWSFGFGCVSRTSACRKPEGFTVGFIGMQLLGFMSRVYNNGLLGFWCHPNMRVESI